MSVLELLRDKQFDVFLARPVPHPLDDVADKVVTAYRTAPGAQRRAMETELDPRMAGILCVYGERTATMAVRNRTPEPLRGGLVALGLAQLALRDYRTNLVPLAAVNHSADTVGVSLSTLLDEIAGDLPERAVAPFRAFADRDASDKSLKAMGLRTEGTGETFRYTSG